MPLGEITQPIIDAFSTVIGSDLPVNQVIKNLDQNNVTATYFTDLLKSLRVLSLDEKGRISIFESRRSSEVNTVNSKPIGQGTFGTIYRNKIGEAVYKKISFTNTSQVELERNIREVFLESYIQTVLSSDISYGGNVSRIIGLYREFPEKTIAGKTTMYIKMEAVSMGIDTLLTNLKERAPAGIKWSSIRPIFKELGNVLKYFEKTYNFHHRDLHTGNVMFDSTGHIKLIDFGKSCITARLDRTPVTFSLVPENIIQQPANLDSINKRTRKSDVPCSSYDLLIFIVSLLEFDSDKFDAACLERLNSFVTQPSGTNLFIFWNAKTAKGKPTFWKMYPDVVEQWEGTTQSYGKGAAAVSDTLTPSETPIGSPSDFVAAIAAAAGGTRTRRRRLSKRRTTRSK